MHPLRRHYSLACCAAPTLLLGTAALAQAPAESQNPLEEIVVTATLLERTLDKTPASVSVVTEDDIQLARQQLARGRYSARAPAARAR